MAATATPAIPTLAVSDEAAPVAEGDAEADVDEALELKRSNLNWYVWKKECLHGRSLRRRR